MHWYRTVLIPIAAAALAACGSQQETTTTAERHLAVTGPREAVERFVRLQGSRRSPLVVSEIRALADGQATATVTIPAEFASDDLNHTTREALAAGLSYEFADVRTSTTAAR